MEKYTLHQLQVHLQRVVALNFPETLWVSCEIAQFSYSRGHIFLQIVQKEEDSDEILAQANANLWAKKRRKLQEKLGDQFSEVLREGVAVLLKVQVDFHPRYGLSLQIEDIDMSYTFGKLALQRIQTLKKLHQLKLIGKNAQLELPNVLQRIAVISSPTAAGYEDFLQQLRHNPYGYHFETQLFPAAMQGQAVEGEVIQQLQNIKEELLSYDVVVIIRGGGAKLDLMAFDSFNLCQAIAQYHLPVFSGIGHEIDETLIEQVVHTPLKTPTAVAEFIIQYNLQFEGHLLELGRQFFYLSQMQIQEAHRQIDQASQQVYNLISNALKEQNRLLSLNQNSLFSAAKLRIQRAHFQLEQLQALQEALNPLKVLERGYSLTFHADGRPIQSIHDVDLEAETITLLQDGRLTSTVTKKSTNEQE